MEPKRIASLVLCCALALSPIDPLLASEHRGQVQFGGLPVPGATITATSANKTLTAVTDPQGSYIFPDLADGVWKLKIEMLGFAPIQEDVAVAPNAPAARWDLHMLPLADMKAVAATPPAAPAAAPTPAAAAVPTTVPNTKTAAKGKGAPTPTNTQTAFQRAEVNATSSEAAAPPGDLLANQNVSELTQRASDGFLVNGTTNNANSSPFAQNQAFGNNRRGPRSLYNGNIGVILDNSALDARPFSLTGQDTPRPAYNRFTGVAAFGGPLKIPHLFNNGPNIFVNYQWTRNRNASTTPGLMPTEAERNGDFFGVVNPLGMPVTVIDPSTGAPFANNTIPSTRFSPQALSLLNLYPLPNFAGSTRYNYQIPIVGIMHQDSMQARINRPINRKNQIFSTFAFQDTRSDNPTIFGFLDTTDTLGISSTFNWRHSFSSRLFGTFGYQYSRQSTRVLPFFANRENIAGEAGITGNNQQPVNWGPPTLNFASGIGDLTDLQSSFTRNQTTVVSYDTLWNRGRHNFSFGGDWRRQQFNPLSQQDPRGTFTFTGAATGYDFAGFLLGIPDTSSIAFGNADKYFRASSYDAYITDDWRVNPSLTLNVGARWEYWAPVTELYGRLVNLDITPGFTAEAPVVASNPAGPLTGQTYPSSLLRPDKHAVQPRLGFSWRPFPASSMVVRGGYGVYYNTSVYVPIATQMAQQSPLSKSLNVANTPNNPLTLASGFNASPTITPNTFAVDPNFLVGYSQNWQLSVQRDLPGSLVMIATYQGSKGTRGVQDFLPNTYPVGAVNPCPTCPSGFAYLASNGNSTREAGQLQLRRRLHNGLTANLQYTYAKAIDDAALGGRNQGQPVIAQNWLDLSAERGLSNFDQRHQVSFLTQYTTGMGIGGGTLVSGWKGALFKEWTFISNFTAGTGLPLSPVFFTPVPGTGVSGPIRPNYTGVSVYNAPPGLFLNPAAYSPPLSGEWGDAGRNSITGPSQLSWNASVGRTFRMSDRMSLDLRVDSTNTLNHVTYPNWNTTVSSAQFGLPNTANAMRSVQTTVRLRF
ncbi:MAG TPA: carboxypeptidase regulatory-like domain-containing protein [Bryobacteraceae bacterium]|nr:carboxypeptidase regulatory-like domain-containing protein [Bryobacteraceae bacterium]